MYCEWSEVVAERVCKLGFDVYASTDDMAFNTQPFFSPKVFRELVVPRFREVAKHITLPWVVHSDGNIMPFLPDLIDLGISGVHPLEKGAMDVAAVKRDYGDRICLLGNVDLNILGLGTEEETEREVYELIHTAGPGGGYIVSSGNSLAGYLKPENVRALSGGCAEIRQVSAARSAGHGSRIAQRETAGSIPQHQDAPRRFYRHRLAVMTLCYARRTGCFANASCAQSCAIWSMQTVTARMTTSSCSGSISTP